MKKLDKMILLSLSLTLLLQSNALAEEKKIERIYGKDRYETSIKVADALSSSLEKVIVASGEMFPDALAGSVLTSGKYPIVLASKDRLDPSVRAKISKAKEVYILGGSETISSAVENDIKSLGAKVSRLSGMDRYETSVKIAQVTGSKDLILVNGDLFPDSLTASGIALLNNRSILLVKSNEIPQSVKDYIKKINPNSITIIGGNKSVDDRLEKESKLFTNNVKRISGRDRYETSLEVAKQFTNLKNLVVASGDNFSDALSASSIAGKLKAPILLVDGKKGTATVNYIEKNKKNIDSIKVVGGPNMVSDSTFKSISNVVETKDVKKEEDKKLIGTIVKPNKDKPSSVKPNTDKPNPEKPNPEKPNPEKPNTDKPNPDKPNTDKPNQENPKLADKPADGVWYGTVFEGYGTEQNGSNIVKVEIEDGRVKSAEPIKHSGTGRDYIIRSKEIFKSLKGKVYSEFEAIISELSNEDLKNRGKYADTVSTATKTARGYVMATEKAVERARKFATDKKQHTVEYIKITGNNEYDPGRDRIEIQSKSKLRNQTVADFDFVKFDILLSTGELKTDVKFTELKKYGIVSNYKQGQILNTDTDHIYLEVKDESGYALEKIRLSVMPAVEKKKIRPDYILVTFEDKSTQRIDITSEVVYDKTFDKQIEKVELYKGSTLLSTGEHRRLQSYYYLDKFANYQLGEDEEWESSFYRLVARVPEKQAETNTPHKVVIKANNGDIIKEVAINSNDWETANKQLTISDIDLPSYYENKLNELTLEVLNEKNEIIKTSSEVIENSIKVNITNSSSNYIKFATLRFIKVTDFEPVKYIIKDKSSKKKITEVNITSEQWRDRNNAIVQFVSIPKKYENKWNIDTFEIEAYNRSEQKLDLDLQLVGKAGVRIVVNDSSIYDGKRTLTVGWKYDGVETEESEATEKITDFKPSKYVIKDKTTDKIISEISITSEQWQERNNAIAQFVSISKKYENKWNGDTFKVEAYNKTDQLLNSETQLVGKAGIRVIVNDNSIDDGKRTLTIGWKYDAVEETSQEESEREYTGEAIARESDAKTPESWKGESSYAVKVKVRVKNGNIIAVEDNESVVGEFNKPYFRAAIGNFAKYANKAISSIKDANIENGDEGINVVTSASVTSKAIHNAVKDALNKIDK
ncbi:cell wall-binding repeat-containing protein [Peptostreptococcus porci]|uniref:cell wall-binding repeat-containing protein n=1 Tax=Peptostreptococcus porci TaxID=2652282 RepID=UPI002A913E95|nr:cell wall-binding repeat-containing protein [Peptostreptococcus porci]MDY5436328.1 cell wall-binding repeat-containing protein [Peptostreptococcus porci]